MAGPKYKNPEQLAKPIPFPDVEGDCSDNLISREISPKSRLGLSRYKTNMTNHSMRNVKLRMSRKLLFVKGMLMCFSQNKVHTDPAETISDLREMVKLHPFELLLKKKDYFELENQDIINLLTCYDQFLSALSDPVKRKHLINLDLKDAFDDPLYKGLKIVGDNFKKTLDQMFIYKKGKLNNLTLKYGIF